MFMSIFMLVFTRPARSSTNFSVEYSINTWCGVETKHFYSHSCSHWKYIHHSTWLFFVLDNDSRSGFAVMHHSICSFQTFKPCQKRRRSGESSVRRIPSRCLSVIISSTRSKKSCCTFSTVPTSQDVTCLACVLRVLVALTISRSFAT
jgi:hypothetical protein